MLLMERAMEGAASGIGCLGTHWEKVKSEGPRAE